MDFDIKKIRDIAYDVIDTIEVPESKVAAKVTYDKNHYSEEVEVAFFDYDEEGNMLSSHFVFSTSPSLGCRYAIDRKYEQEGAFKYDVSYDECLEELKKTLVKWGIIINDYFGV